MELYFTLEYKCGIIANHNGKGKFSSASLVAQLGKNLSAMQEIPAQFLG